VPARDRAVVERGRLGDIPGDKARDRVRGRERIERGEPFARGHGEQRLIIDQQRIEQRQ